MLEKMRELRKQARKDGDSVAKFAYEAVISECDRKSGQLIGRGVNESEIIKILKNEIGKYKEMEGKQAEIDLLEVFVPVMLSDEELMNILEGLEEFKSPKLAMDALDTLGHKDRYNKGLVAKFVLKK